MFQPLGYHWVTTASNHTHTCWWPKKTKSSTLHLTPKECRDRVCLRVCFTNFLNKFSYQKPKQWKKPYNLGSSAYSASSCYDSCYYWVFIYRVRVLIELLWSLLAERPTLSSNRKRKSTNTLRIRGSNTVQPALTVSSKDPSWCTVLEACKKKGLLEYTELFF